MEDYRSKVEGLKAELLQEVTSMIRVIQECNCNMPFNHGHVHMYLMLDNGGAIIEVYEHMGEITCLVKDTEGKDDQVPLRKHSVDTIADVANVVAETKTRELKN